MSIDSFGDLYPERRGALKAPSKLEVASGGARHSSYKDVCYANMISAMEYPLIKLMMSALKSAGCPLVPSRHFACDICKSGSELKNAGGYDPDTNQIFFCSNNSKKFGTLHGHLFRQLLVMYDVCTKKVDFNNQEHLACLEVRKANLGDCNFLVYFSSPFSKFELREKHKVCVRNIAARNLSELRNLDQATSEKLTDKVFLKCYNDLEPVGRRCIDRFDMKRAQKEAVLAGYGWS